MSGKKIIEYYDNPIIRTLIQLVPLGIGSAIDVALTETIDGIRTKRAKIFFDELSKGKIELTEEVIRNEEFLHLYFTTYRAAANTYRKEKIELFARLFKNGTVNRDLKNVEEIEDYIKILESLSYTDIVILREIELFEEKFSNSRGKEVNKEFVEPFDVLPDWHTYLFERIEELGLTQEEFVLRLYRLQSLGLFEKAIEIGDNKVSKFDTSDFTGRLTPLFHKLFELIKEEENDLQH